MGEGQSACLNESLKNMQKDKRLLILCNKRSLVKRNKALNELIASFSELYWLKPVDIVWDAVNAYHVEKFIKLNDIILDLGCGDGLYSFLMFGGRLPLEYDRFVNVKPAFQKIESGQGGDIYTGLKTIVRPLKMPRRKIDFGLELKTRHIKVAESLGIYNRIMQASFEKIPLEDEVVDKVYSIFAFYWGNDLAAQTKEVRRVLKTGGELIVNLPSEYPGQLHISKRIAQDNKYSDSLRAFMEKMDGGRFKLTTRHARNVKQWQDFFVKQGFEFMDCIPVVNEIVFVMQDISQRPFLPYFFAMLKQKGFSNFRQKVKKFLCTKVYPNFIDELLRYEGDPKVRHGYYIIRARKK
jgi:ubiquinone/menaquinone biosynthesis C-methylase UbiE